MNYLKLLQDSHKETAENRGYKDLGRLEFLAEDIFGFTTYENFVSSLMAKKSLEVCKAISERKTFDYIKTEEGHLWYLIVVNMPFFQGKLEWGTSIRGAWWDLCGKDAFKLNSCGLFSGGEQLLEIELNEKQWMEFIHAMIEFASE